MKKDKLINLRVSSEKHKKYVEFAESKGMKLSNLIRLLIEKEIEKNANK